MAAWLTALSEHGFQVNEEILYLYEGAIEPRIAAELFSAEGHAMNQEMFHSVLTRQKEIFVSDFSHQVKPFSEIPDMLECMKRKGMTLALVTSSHGEILDAVLPGHISSFFDKIITGDQVKKRKPHPEPYVVAMTALGVKANGDAAAVENAPAGIRSAKAAGLHTIAITTTLPVHHLKDADEIISRHNQLMDIL